MPFGKLWMSSQARMLLDNMRPSRARSGAPRTLRRVELEERLDQLAAIRGDAALNELRDGARALAPALDAQRELDALDELLGALLGTRDAKLATAAARARQSGQGYDTARLLTFETLRAELARQDFAARPEPADPGRLFAFFEAYFSNWIEGTQFEVGEAAEIVFEGKVPPQRPADAHDVQGTFDTIVDARLRSAAPSSADEFEEVVAAMHRRVMGGRPDVAPGRYKSEPNRAGATTFVHPDLVRGTLREGFSLYSTLPAGMPRAVYAMFLIAEVHPFADGNGRVARALMNAELTAAGQCRVMIPLPYRDEYLNALRALSRNGNPRPLWRMVERAQRWASLMAWTDRDRVLAAMTQTHALTDPRDAGDSEIRLLDPAIQGQGELR